GDQRRLLRPTVGLAPVQERVGAVEDVARHQPDDRLVRVDAAHHGAEHDQPDDAAGDHQQPERDGRGARPPAAGGTAHPAIPTTGWLSRCPPTEPRNRAAPNAKMPPSLATSQYPSPAGA